MLRTIFHDMAPFLLMVGAAGGLGSLILCRAITPGLFSFWKRIQSVWVLAWCATNIAQPAAVIQVHPIRRDFLGRPQIQCSSEKKSFLAEMDGRMNGTLWRELGRKLWLTLRWMLETAVGDRPEQLWLQQKISKSSRMNADITTLLIGASTGDSQVALLRCGSVSSRGRICGCLVSLKFLVGVIDEILFVRHLAWSSCWWVFELGEIRGKYKRLRWWKVFEQATVLGALAGNVERQVVLTRRKVERETILETDKTKMSQNEQEESRWIWLGRRQVWRVLLFFLLLKEWGRTENSSSLKNSH